MIPGIWASNSWPQLRSWCQGHEFKPHIGLHTGHGAYLKKQEQKLKPLSSLQAWLLQLLCSCSSENPSPNLDISCFLSVLPQSLNVLWTPWTASYHFVEIFRSPLFLSPLFLSKTLSPPTNGTVSCLRFTLHGSIFFPFNPLRTIKPFHLSVCNFTAQKFLANKHLKYSTHLTSFF